MQAVLLALALAVIVDGLLGPQISSANLAGVLPWTYWRAFVVIALLAAGNFFCMACPFMLFRELGRRLGLRQRSWPRALRSKWFSVVLLVLFFWSYEVFGLWDKPIWTAWLIINYFLVAFAVDALFRARVFANTFVPSANSSLSPRWFRRSKSRFADRMFAPVARRMIVCAETSVSAVAKWNSISRANPATSTALFASIASAPAHMTILA